MATGMIGANPEALRELGAGFASWADALEESRSAVIGGIESVSWLGDDADAYRDAHMPALEAAFWDIDDRLRFCRTDCDAQADEQDDASRGGERESCLQSTWNGIGDFFGGLVMDGLVDDVKSIFEGIVDLPRMAGFDENWQWSWDNVVDAWSPLGPFIGYNPEDGTWRNWGMMRDAWFGQVKDFLAWDMWGENWPRALGQVTWNIGSCFLGVGIIKRIDGILEEGRRRRDGDDDDSSAPEDRYASGDPLRPGEHPPRRPTLGDADGGPGQWTEINRRNSGTWQEYQEQITGIQGDPGRPIEYRVDDGGHDVDFDGRTQRGTPPQETYLEAKGRTWFFDEKNADKPYAAGPREAELNRNVEQINRQVDALPEGARIEWHCESQAHADALRERVEREGYDNVDVIHTPRA